MPKNNSNGVQMTGNNCRANGAIPGLSPELLSEFCGISVRTARRWLREGLPDWAVRICRVFVAGELAPVCPAFDGWRIERGALRSHDGRIDIQPAQLGWFHWFPAELERQRAEIRALKSDGLGLVKRQQVWAAIESLAETRRQSLAAAQQLAGLLGAEELDAEIENDHRHERPPQTIRLR